MSTHSASSGVAERQRRASGSRVTFLTPGNVPTTRAQALRAHQQWNHLRDHHTIERRQYAQDRARTGKRDPRATLLKQLEEMHTEGTRLTTANELRANELHGPSGARASEQYAANQRSYQELVRQIRQTEDRLKSATTAASPSRAGTSKKAVAPKASGTRAPSPATRAKALNAELTRAVTNPEDSQHFHRAYAALHDYLDSLTPAQRTKAEAAIAKANAPTTPRTRTSRSKKSTPA